jgi:hypothetical protein
MRATKIRTSAPKGHTNKRMDNSVYAERRQVIDLIYKAKNLLRANGFEMPRIDIRITTKDMDVSAIGVAQMKGNYIWIPDTSLGKSYLYQIVLHELCHAIWGVEHNLKCKLMHTHLQSDLTDSLAESLFIGYAKKYQK